MAVVFGGESRFQTRKSFRYGALFILILAMMFAVADLALLISRRMESGPLMLASVIFFGLAALSLSKVGDRYMGRFIRSEHGLDGEAAIAAALRSLPDSFAVFRGLKVSDHQDIDFSVIGPTGIYAVEAKSHKGKIGYDGQALTRNGRRFEKDFLSEATREASGLRRMIRSASADDAFVDAIVAFSSPHAAVGFGSEKIRNVFVVGRAWLPGIITNGPDAHAVEPARTLKIATALAALVPDKDRENKIARLKRALQEGE